MEMLIATRRRELSPDPSVRRFTTRFRHYRFSDENSRCYFAIDHYTTSYDMNDTSKSDVNHLSLIAPWPGNRSAGQCSPADDTHPPGLSVAMMHSPQGGHYTDVA